MQALMRADEKTAPSGCQAALPLIYTDIRFRLPKSPELDYRTMAVFTAMLRRKL